MIVIVIDGVVSMDGVEEIICGTEIAKRFVASLRNELKILYFCILRTD